ncbi:MAG TPA: FAD-dependent oxidoreductase [Spirochaetota bacterium]|nr:FAD-dependent oxidoreductase [Spirochaetota bacterium]HOM38634.1 FAD-dependent oxidoreductase [Spirochaetota bacterium]HPQ49771.1 FAD-dependent oxidoreductase [Spirochaetota bacterium]
MKKICIVGGVAGGATCAARLRRNSEDAKITLFERDSYISYANCGLPYYIGDTIKDRNNLFVQTPDAFSKRFNIDVRVNNEVIDIDKEHKKIKVKNLKTGEEYEENYDYLVLSPGAKPFIPNIEGINNPGIFTLRNVNDTDNIKEYIKNNDIKRAVVVGAGFIGLEMAENLHNLGIFVTIVEMAEQVMTPLDYEMASLVHQHLKTKGIEFYLKDKVLSIRRERNKNILHLESRRQIPAELIILSIGVRPEITLAQKAGLKIGEKGIWINRYLQTSDPYIYAIGDAIEFPNPITGKPMITYLAGPANKQGRIAADNIIFENKREYKGSINTAIAKVFDLTVASTGLSEKTLKSENIDYLTTIIHVSSHAGYYPGALPLTIKITFSRDGKLYGAQLVGYEGVDKRTDLLSSIIQKNGTIYDLQLIEHSYAPPYSSAKDPVNIAGFVAENIIENKVKIVSYKDILNRDKETVIIDVRTPDEYELGNIEGAINIPLDTIRDRIKEIPKDKKLIIYCGTGLRSYIACRILSQSGFENVCNLSGGYKTYETVIAKQSNEDIFEKNYIGVDDIIYSKREEKTETIDVDACGLSCPGPILKLKTEIEKVANGSIIKVKATDPGFVKDVKAWCEITGNKLINQNYEKGIYEATIQKESKTKDTIKQIGNQKTIIVFSNELDRVLASFVIALGAASTGAKVSMFFTFWGLNVLRKKEKVKVKKDIISKMFSLMLPKTDGFKLSKMNFLGIGKKIMKMRMKKNNVDTLDNMIKKARENNIEFIACQMSMDVMGIKREELIEGVKIGGVATYLEDAEKSNINLFI